MKRITDLLLDSEIHDHSEPITHSPYWNKDIAPVGKAHRTWSVKDYAVLWISMSASARVPSWSSETGIGSR